MNVTLEDLVDEYLCNSSKGKLNGEDFWIIDTWREVESFILAAVRVACGEEIVDKYYRSRNAVKERYGTEGIRYGDLRVGQPDRDYNGKPDGILHEKSPYLIPDEVTEGFIKAGFIKEGKRADLANILEADWGFSDEYQLCSCCYEVVHTSPDSYSWTKDYEILEWELICGNCIREDESLQKEYIDFLTNNPEKANTILEEKHFKKYGYVKLSETGYVDREEFDVGWYEWNNNDDPESQLSELSDYFENVIFDITSVGQFETSWQIWVKDSMIEDFVA